MNTKTRLSLIAKATTMNMNTKIRLSLLNLAAAALLAIPPIASATILASDGFESNTPGALAGQGGGTGWAGNWTAPGRWHPARTWWTPPAARWFTPFLAARPSTERPGRWRFKCPGLQPQDCCSVSLRPPIVTNLLRRLPGALRRELGGTWAGGNNTFTLHLGTDATQHWEHAEFRSPGGRGGGDG